MTNKGLSGVHGGRIQELRGTVYVTFPDGLALLSNGSPAEFPRETVKFVVERGARQSFSAALVDCTDGVYARIKSGDQSVEVGITDLLGELGS